MSEPDPTRPDCTAFLGLRLRSLDQIISAQGRHLLELYDVRTPHVCVSMLRFIALYEPTTVTELSEKLSLSRQLVLQRLASLEGAGLAASKENKLDRRSRLISLTPAGQKEDHVIRELLIKIERAFEQLEQELKTDLSSIMLKAHDLLLERNLSDRVLQVDTTVSRKDSGGAS